MKYRELVKKYSLIEQALRLGTAEGNQLAVQIAYTVGRHDGFTEGAESVYAKADRSFKELQKKSEDRIANLTELMNDGK